MNAITTLLSLIDLNPQSALWWLARVTVVAGFACALLALMRHARPAIRHAVATASLAGIALLPLAAAMLPAWSLPVLPGQPSAHPVEFALADRGDAGNPVARNAVATLPAPVSEPIAHETALPAREAAAPVAATQRGVLAGVDWGRALMAGWVLVAMVLFLRLIVAALKVRGWVRGARPSDDRRVLFACEEARRVLGIPVRVDVLMSENLQIPVMVGVLRPRVLLPASASRWSDERLRVVLLHELAHAQRGDGFWMLLSRAVTAALWFHPAVWYLSRQVRRESERACDDAVLTAGVRGSEYAHHLIAIARTSRFENALPETAVAFAARSSLERRIASILTAAPRRTPSRRVVASLAAFSIAVAIAVAVAQPVEVESAQLSRGEMSAIDAGRQMDPGSEPAFVVKPAVAQRVNTKVARREYVKSKAKYTQHKEFMVADRKRSREARGQYGDASDLYDRGRYKDAAALYEAAAREGHRSDTAWYNAACCWALAGETAKAVDALQASFDEGFDRLRYYAEDSDLNSLRGDPRFRKFMDDVMNSDVAKRQRRSALREFEYLEKQDKVDDGDWNSVGVDLMRTGDYQNAETAFDREYKNGGSSNALYNMACLKAVSGKPDDALNYLDRAIREGAVSAEHMEEDPDLVALHGRDRFDRLVEFAEDMQLGASEWSWSWGWGRKSEARRWRKSLDRFEEMTKKYPDVGRAWFNLGFAQLKAGFPQESTGSFQKALDMKYRPEITMYNLACTNAQSGNVDKAFDWLDRADKAGHPVWRSARGDRDLDPLHDDPRWDKLTETWKEQAKTAGEHWGYHYGWSSDDHDHDHDHDHDEDDKRYD